MSVAAHNYPPLNNNPELRAGFAPAEAVAAEAFQPPQVLDAQIIPIDALAGQEAAAPPPNPFAEHAQMAAERALGGRSEAQVVRVGRLIGYAFGKRNLTDADMRLYQAALNSTPGTTYLGDGNYQVGPAPAGSSENQNRRQSPRPPEISQTMSDLVETVISRIKPGPPFTGKLLLGLARSINGILSSAEVSQFFDAVAASSRLAKTEGGTYTLITDEAGEQAAAYTGPEDDYEPDDIDRPFALSDRIIKKHTLDGMIRAALEPGRTKKPSHGRKHPGYKRFDNMDNYVPDPEY